MLSLDKISNIFVRCDRKEFPLHDIISESFIWYARKEFLSHDMILSKHISIGCARNEIISLIKSQKSLSDVQEKNFCHARKEFLSHDKISEIFILCARKEFLS